MVACCESMPFLEIQMLFDEEIMYLSVCRRDLKFNGVLLRIKVILEIDVEFLLEILYSGHSLGI